MNDNLKATKSNEANDFFITQPKNAPKIIELTAKELNTKADIEYFMRSMRNVLMIHWPETCVICQREQLEKETQEQILRQADYIYHLTQFLIETGITPNIELLTELWKERELELERIKSFSKIKSPRHLS